MPTRSVPAVLFVDDQPDVTSALEMAFHRKPFAVHTANSGLAALQILAGTLIDVVVSDEHMPGMCGSELLTIIRRQYPETIRIVLSGQADLKATLAAINEARAHHFLIKPCTPDDIALCLTKALSEREKESCSAGLELPELQLPDRTARQFKSALNSLWIAFQPVVRPGTNQIFAYEALLRSHHPELNTPLELFAAAEASRAVTELEQSIRYLIAQRADEVPQDVHIMVNILPRSLCDSDLYSADAPLYKHRNRVIFEITERDKLEHVPDASEKLARLRSLGYRVAVDDLGAGYSGLNSFASILPDIVKFDMELIRNIQLSPAKCNLVRLMTQLCKQMNILTVAEGIESEAEYKTLTELGCDLLQGFLIAEPAAELCTNSKSDDQRTLMPVGEPFSE